eukprot:XP_003520325.1 uncharacterized protein LOC100777212 [Glycine max]
MAALDLTISMLTLIVVVSLGLWSGVQGALQVPCYFIFGDSLVNNGNNNQLQSLARVDYLPYGIDFPGGPSRRFSNGKTTMQLVTELLGFDDYIPPYVDASGDAIFKGVNYASATAGIREETGQQQGGRISFSGQVQNYQSTVSQLVNLLGNKDSAANYLSKCIYSIGLGSNDYLNNYFMPQFYSSSRQYSQHEYADVLILAYTKQVKTLYNYGPRKMVLFGICQIGFSPNELAQNSPDGKTCVEKINYANEENMCSKIDIAFARDSTILAIEPLADYPSPYEIPHADSTEPPSQDNSPSNGSTEYIELYSMLLEYFDLTRYGVVVDGRTDSSSEKTYETPCDNFDGKWIRDRRGPLYNSTTCGTIKEGQNCITRGRPNSGYLYWRWKPSKCSLPRFEAQTFLQLVSNKHVAFAGDSVPMNQLKSFLCMLSTGSTLNLVYRNDNDNIIVLSIGHWFLHLVVYYEGGLALGCHNYPSLNHTEIGFYDVLRKALKTTLNSIIVRRGVKAMELM